MKGLIALADVVLMSRVLEKGLPMMQANKTGHRLLVLAGLFLAIGTGFLIYALHVWMAREYSLEVAAAVTGGIALFFAFLFAGAAFLYEHLKNRKIAQIKSDVLAAIGTVLDVAEETAATPVRENPKAAMATAAVTGFLAGERLF